MRRSIQDLVASIDPNVKMDPEVEDARLNFKFLLCGRADARYTATIGYSGRVYRLGYEFWLSIGQASGWRDLGY